MELSRPIQVTMVLCFIVIFIIVSMDQLLQLPNNSQKRYHVIYDYYQNMEVKSNLTTTITWSQKSKTSKYLIHSTGKTKHKHAPGHVTNFLDLSFVASKNQLDSFLRCGNKAGCRNGNVQLSTGKSAQNIQNPDSPPYITVKSHCRLGNQMFQYAVLYSFKNRPAWTPYVHRQGFRILRNIFMETLTLPVLDGYYDNLQVHENNNADIMLDLIDFLPRWKNLTLSGYFQSHKFFGNVSREIRREFRFPKLLMDRVAQFFRNNTDPEWTGAQVIRVGVHIRRGDMVSAGRQQLGVIPTPASFFMRAMDYFVTRFPRVQFFVASDDITWCKDHVTGDHVVYSRQNYETDFAMLASCDHVIVSVGTYSWWAGWLCNGITIYYGVQPPNGTYMAMMYENNKWIPPKDEYNNWIPIA